MNKAALAQIIILQSIEDIFSAVHRTASIRFFSGQGFRHAADIAGLTGAERKKIMLLAKNISAVSGKRPAAMHKSSIF